MLLPLRPGELERLIPAVASGNQFSSALGDPQKILQRVLIATIGGVISFLFSASQTGNQFSSVWLVVCVVFFTYLLWGPILEAGRMNSKLRRIPFAALFEGQIGDVFTRELIENRHEQANSRGELELVENRRLWMILHIEDEEGYLGELRFPMDKKHNSIRQGLCIRCVVLSDNKDFRRISALTDAWIPAQRLWVGEYPFLLRPAFEELCILRLSKRRS